MNLARRIMAIMLTMCILLSSVAFADDAVCTHPEEYTESRSWTTTECAPSEDFPEWDHYYYTVTYSQAYCTNCSQYTGTAKETNRDYISAEDHIYESGSNVCTKCGYENVEEPEYDDPYFPEYVRDLPINVTWNDDDNAASLRPESVTVSIYRDGGFLTSSTISGDMTADTWSIIFRGIPNVAEPDIADSSYTYDSAFEYTGEYDGHTFVYTVTMDAVPGYTTVQSGTSFTNTYEPAVCEHPSDSVTSETTYSDYYYVDCGDNHSVCATETTTYTCTLCNTVTDTQILYAQVTGYADHNYENGFCTFCNAQGSDSTEPAECGHPAESCTYDTTYEGESYDDINEEYHTYCYAVKYLTTTCSLCSYTFTEEVEHDGAVEQPHSYNENGLCVCGRSNAACAHPEESRTFVDKKLDDIDFENCTNAEHTLAGTYYSRYLCGVCGETFVDIYGESEPGRVTETHTYCVDDEGSVYCSICGHTNTCEHPNAHNVEYISNATFEYDDYTHTITGPKYSDLYCDDCCYTISSTELGMSTIFEEHSFIDGVCTACLMSCAHPEDRVVTMTDWEDATYTGVDYAYHTVTGTRIVHDYCKECSAFVGSDEITENASGLEAHTYSDGVCDYCKETNYCSHAAEFVEDNIWFENATFDPIDEETHRTTGDMYSWQFCNNCLTYLTEEPIVTENTSAIETHSFTDGACYYCGEPEPAESECEHPANFMGYRYSWVDESANSFTVLDSEKHIQTGDELEEYFCGSCSTVVSSRVIEGSQVEETHTFINGVCVCGAAESAEPGCAHKNVFRVITTDNDSYVPINEAEHSFTADYTYISRCMDCDAVILSQPVADDYTKTEKHEYYNGKCELCEYESSCEHPEESMISEAYYENNGWSGDYELSDTPETTHVRVETVLCLRKTCGVCGAVVYDDIQNESAINLVEEEHVYFDGVCNCGHEQTIVCDHPAEHLIVVEEGNFSVVINSVTDDYHSVSCQRFKTFQCGVCNERWDTDEILIDSSEIHTYSDNGKCYLCGAEKPSVEGCTHPAEYVGTTEWREGGIYYEEYDADTHSVTSTYCVQPYCGLCETAFGEVTRTDNYTTYEDHTFENGAQCTKCSMCLHPSGHVRTKVYAMNDDYDPDGISGHIHTCDLYVANECGICYSEYDTRLIKEDVTFKREHNYDDNGFCIDCGYENTCEHPEEARKYVTWYDCLEGFTDITDTTHTVLESALWEEVSCSVCGEWLSADVIDSDTINSRTEPHKYYEGSNECECGHINTCEHPAESISETYELACEDPYAFTDITDTTHTVHGRYYYTKSCTACNTQFEFDYIDVVDLTEPHSYEDGVCLCGAEEPVCEHPAESVETDSYYDFDNATYEQIPGDDNYHYVYAYCYTSTYCPVCDSYFGEEVRSETPEQLMLDHEYENDVCVNCGYDPNAVPECEHPADNVITESYWETESFTAIDNRQHEVTGTLITRNYCQSCGEYFGEDIVDEGASETRNHYYVDGVCEDCKHVNTCEHPVYEQVTLDNIEDLVCTPYDNMHHTNSGTRIVETYCELCGECIGKEVTEGYSELSTHNYYEGYCDSCGHTNTCEHPDEDLEIMDCFEFDSYVPFNNKYHDERGWSYQEISCSACGEMIDIVYDDEPTIYRMEHYYVNGTCLTCEHVNTCEHTDTSARYTNYTLEQTGIEYVDDMYHTRTYKMYEKTYCDGCGMLLVSSVVLEAHTVKEEHEFGEYGCECGGVFPCLHPDKYVSVVESTQDERYTYVDEDTHTLTSRAYTYKHCSLCGEIFNEETAEDKTTVTEAHSFYNGVCSCKYVNPCDHSSSEVYSSGYIVAGRFPYTVVSTDASTHTVTCIMRHQKYCADCGEYLGFNCEPDVTVTGHHTFIDGECSLCGYEAECEHPESGLTTFEKVFYGQLLASDADTHTHYGHVYEVTQCGECGAYVESVYSGGMEEITAPHDYIDGECIECGAEEPSDACTHPEEFTQTETWTEDDNFVNSGATHHIFRRTTYSRTYCSKCSSYTTEEPVVESYCNIEMPHVVGSGKCVCGLVPDCEHADEFVDSDMSYIGVEFEPIDNKYHYGTYDVYESVYCDNCGLYLTFNEYCFTETDEYWHDYDEDGVCTECKHVNTCEHPEDSVESDHYLIDVEITPVDNKYHAETGKRCEYTECGDCGITLSETIGGVDTEQYYHDYDENGVCYECKHVNTCEHPEDSVEVYEGFLPEDCEYLNEKYHTVYGTEFITTECDLCGIVVSEEKNENCTERWMHEYENGTCEGCGYVNTCEHPLDARSEFYYNYAKSYTVNEAEGTHTGIYYVYKYSTCNTCGHIFGEEPLYDNYEFTDEHMFYDGECECGLANPCTHPAEYVDSTGWYHTNDTYEYVDEETHSHTYNLLRFDRCTKCGDEFNMRETDEELTELESHGYHDGICFYCDAENSCEHPEDKIFTREIYNPFGGSYVITDEYHTFTGLRYYNTYCGECNEVLYATSARDITYTERHIIDNGKCVRCGHVPACEHPEGSQRTYDSIIFDYAVVSYDESGHTLHGPVRTIIECDICGSVRNGGEWEDGFEYMTLPHDYINGYCCVCGAEEPESTLAITAQPVSVTVPEGAKATVKVEAEGEGLTYQWYFAEAGTLNFYKASIKTATYSVEMNSARNGRQLYCVVTDKYGYSVQTSTVTISMAAPLTIVTQPESVTVAEGEKATVKVEANGEGLTYAWYIANPDSDDFTKSGTTTATYSVIMNESRNGRQLYCIITDKYGRSVQTDVVFMTMVNELTITEQPEGVTVPEGSKAVVKVAAEGDGLKYQWYYAAAGSDTFYKASITSATYSVDMNASRNGRRIYCVVTDRYGNSVTSDIVTIAMAAPLTIVAQPKSVSVGINEKASVTVVAEGEGLTYQWYYAAADSDTFYKASIVTATYTTLMTESRNGRQLYCVITDKYGRSVTSDTVVISMAAPLVITAQPESITVADGQKATVKVAAKGDGLTYQWYIANPDSDNFSKSSTTTATYSVIMNDSRNGRQLYCVVTDKYGNSLQSDVAVISMETPLVITAQPESITVAEGQKATVKVAAKGDGLTYQWYIANPDSDNFSKSSTTTATYSVIMNASRDGRQLYCVVTDKYGNTVTSDIVTIEMAAPLAITSQPVSATAAEGEKVSVKVVAEGEGLTYQWYIAAADSDTFSKSSITSSTYSTVMTAARDGRQIYCLITDKYGNTVQSDVVTISIASGIVITAQPTDAAAADGEKVSVKVVAEGEGLTYQWYIAAADSDNFSKSSITTATYSTVMNATRDGRQIYCLITDKYGNTAQTDIVTISIASELAITLQPVSVTVAEGTKAVVTLKATGDGLTYEWYYKNAGATKFTKTTAFTGNSYYVEMNAARDGRQIYCVVNDKYGNSVTSDTVTLSME